MNNGRDCPHGRQVGKCDTCDLIEAEKEIARLEAQLVEVNNNRTDVSPCAKFCEALAAKKMFDNLQSENAELKAKISELQNDVLAKSIADLTRKNSELQAQVELFCNETTGLAAVVFSTSKALIEATDTLERELLPAIEDADPLTDLITSLRDAIQSTPAQCLAEVRALALDDAREEIIQRDIYHTCADFLEIRANQLRQQAKDGE